MRYCVCADIMYFRGDMSLFLKSMQETKEAGFDAIEFWSWQDRDLDAIVKAKQELGLEIVSILPGRGSMVDPAARDAFVAMVKAAIEPAKKLGCKNLILTTGPELAGVSREDQHISVVDGLKACAPILEDAGMIGILEPLNQINHAGYFLSSTKESFDIIDEVGSPAIKLLFDVYHQQITDGNLIYNITNNIEKIGHFHGAGNPGRNEITAGEINYSEVFKAIDATNYSGYFGLEYAPTKSVLESLKEVKKICV